MNLKAILGLGNEGRQYKNTYHNVGQLMIDFLSQGDILPEKIVLSKNIGFMNESGNSALALLTKIGAKPEELLVIHDDSDVALGEFKISEDRGSAGHKGVEDIINKIGKKFLRLRIGIRPAQENTRLKAEEFVLNKIKEGDFEVLQKVFASAGEELARQLQ